jgi:anaerobic selenocysteine-containing dehydrogenase
MPLGSHSDERNPKTWRTVETDIPAIMGYFPPNVVPEEILSQKEDRLRAMIISGSNPLRSYADTLAYEKAFEEMELLVNIEISMTETSLLSHYVLPGRSAFEKWDATLFNITFPEIYFQLRHPCCEARGEPLEEGEIFTRLADALEILSEIPDSLVQAAKKDRKSYGMELMKYMGEEKKASRLLPFIVAKTLGESLGSAHLSAAWGVLIRYPQYGGDDLKRAGYNVHPFLGDELFQSLLEHPEGILIGRLDPDNNLEKIRTDDKKIHLYIEEMSEWIQEIDPTAEKQILRDEQFPLVLVAGRHFPYTANSIMRDPDWNDQKTVCTMLMNRQDAENLGIQDGDEASVTTAASSLKVPVEVSDIAVPGTVMIPHGFGMLFNGKAYGINVNQLAKNTHRDRIAATPLHRYVPCRVEAA